MDPESSINTSVTLPCDQKHGLAQDETLSTDHLNEVHTKLYKARNEWFNLGLALSIDHDTLTAIKTEQHDNQGDCLREMLARRIKSGGPLTWAVLSSCLTQPAVGRNDVADQLEPQQVRSQVLPRNLKSIDSEELQQKTEEIDKKFGKLAAKIYRSLITRNISKDSLVACLMGFNCLSESYKGYNPSLFRKQRTKLKDPNSNWGTVWSIVGEYFSFFDYEVLEVITDTLGSDKDKEDFSIYKRDFEEYAKQRLFTSQASPDSGIDPNRENTVLFKLDALYVVGPRKRALMEANFIFR